MTPQPPRNPDPAAPDEPEVPFSGVPAHLAQDMTIAEQGEWLQSFWKRHPVSRRSAIAGSLGTFGVLAMSASPWAQRAAAAVRAAQKPSDVRPRYTGRNVVAGRHVGFGAELGTTMWVSGEVFDYTGARPNPGSSVVVDYGVDSSYGQTVAAEVRQLVTTLPYVDSAGSAQTYALTQYFVHAKLSGLNPGTTYHWRFRLTTDDSSTADATFTTAAAAGSTVPFTFTAFADHGINAGAIPSVYQPASASGVATDDYYNATGTKATNPPKDPFDDESDRATTGRRKDAVPNRTQYPANSLVDVVVSQKPVFNLVGGDIAYADPAGAGLAEYWAAGAQPAPAPSTSQKGYPDRFDPTIWSAYFVQNDRSASNTAWMYALGNHDQEAVYDGNPQSYSAQPGYTAGLANHGYLGHASRINLLGGSAAGTPSPSVYSFRYANVGVVAVDCNDLSKEIQANTGYSGGAQLTWLDRTLSTLRGDATIDYVVAFFHHCAYATSSNHHSDAGVRQALAPLFTKYQVDVAFQGHNHQFERTDPLKYDASTGATTVGAAGSDGGTVSEWQGTTYINNGSAGRPRYGMDPDASVADPVTGAYTERFRGNPDTQGSENITSKIYTGVGQTVADPVTWSQARYDDYAVCVVDVVPAASGGRSTMTIRTLNDFGTEVDRVTLAKTAGMSAPVLPESPLALLLPAAGLVVAGGAYAGHRALAGRRAVLAGDAPVA